MGKFLVRKGTTDFQYINYAYEREIKKYIEQNLGSFDVFIDIGACIGEYSIWLAGLGKKCIAIEPVNYKAVFKNIELSRQGNRIKVFTCGLGSKKEHVYFQVLAENTGASYRDKDAKEEPNVHIETFDSLIDQFDIKDSDRVLIKLDAEGMEPEVFAGAKEFIRRQKHLTFIYEQFQGDTSNDKALSAIADFDIRDIDIANRIAVKK
jgi:FkbM family methyltransferase